MKAKLIKGFTLIEMLIVIAIIAILAGALIINLRGTRGQAADARRVVDLQRAQGALEAFYNKYHNYPCDADPTADCSSVGEGPLDWDNLKLAVDEFGKLATPQATGETYDYYFGNNAQNYALRTILVTAQDSNTGLRKDSEKGTIYGLDCTDDQSYCVQF